jgi:chemotaxis-related protein WspD
MNVSPDSALSLKHAAIVDCWNKIGVRGDSSCPKLGVAIHCRNCRVYSTAAVDLLDAELPTDYGTQDTLEIAREKTLSEIDTHSVLIFRIGGEWLALATGVLQEIVSLRPIHSIPHRRDGVLLGLANIRGELLACFSLEKVLRLGEATLLKPLNTRVSGRLLVIQHEGQRAVCPVDEVHGIVRFHPRDLAPAPATVTKATASYTRSLLSWADKSVGLLDDELLFHTVNRNLA